ncbi:MAG: glycerate dehydrogenase [Verrucomicrobiaceae bacterium]|nr:glycerate dehydrogenase [Verrucomicrobiaceae bacterium]
MNIVMLDAFTANPSDLSWAAFEALGTVTYHDRTPPAEIVERAKDAEVIITNKCPLSRQTLAALPKLRYVGVIATGFNIVDVAAAKELGITVTNVPGYSSASVAQAVFSLLLELTNRTGHHANRVSEGAWAACPDFSFWDYPIVELQGLTLGLVGLGDIGQSVSRIARAFGMNVIATRRNTSTQPPAGVTLMPLAEVLSQSDVLSLHCPLTDDTRLLINAESLAKMKSSAYLINTARGPLVDEPALADALNNGRLSGAGLDVLTVEPPAPGNPLSSAKNCLITPHVAWASRAARTRLIAMCAENVKQWIGGNARNVVS